MVDFKARRHRLELPATPSTDDPAVLKRAMDQMKRLVQDEFNRLATDFYDFKQTTYNAAIIPLRGVSNIAVVKDQYGVSATWELPDGDEITPTHVRVRILEISPNSWSLYTYPKTSWEFNGLTPGTQYTLQVQLVATFEATDSFISTTRNCPSVPVLRTAESDIKAKVFTTDDGVGPPVDGGTNNEVITFNFPNTQGTPGTVSGSDCWWEYKIQYRAACAWVDTGAGGAEVDGDVGAVTIDTASAPFTTYPNALFRLAYREICDSVPEDWVYAEPFMAVDYADADCLGIVKSASLTATPYSTATLFALPSVCQEDGTWMQIVDALTDTEFFPQEPGFKCIEYMNSEWTLIADDTTDTAISGTIYQSLLSGTIAAIADFNAETDFTLSFEINVPDNSLVLAGGTGAYTIVEIGGKIKAQMIQNTASYSLQIVVPRDGGGAYVFRVDGIEYGEWVNFYYVHDVSEADGRVLYLNGTEMVRSANAIANDFDGITGDVQIYTVNDMMIRQIYAWDIAVDPDDILIANELYDATCAGTDVSPDTLNVEVGDVVFVTVVYRDIGASGVGLSGFSGTATFGSISEVTADIGYDTGGVSRGASQLFAAVCTAAGTLTGVSPTPSSTRAAWVVCPGLETAGATDVTEAWGTVTTTTVQANQTLSHTPGAATAGGYRMLHFLTGGGDDVNPMGRGTLEFSSQPGGVLSRTNQKTRTSAYTGFTQIHALAAYAAASYQWVVSGTLLTSGGQTVTTIELVED